MGGSESVFKQPANPTHSVIRTTDPVALRRLILTMIHSLEQIFPQRGKTTALPVSRAMVPRLGSGLFDDNFAEYEISFSNDDAASPSGARRNSFAGCRRFEGSDIT